MNLMMEFLKLSHKQKYWLDFLILMTQKEIKTRYKHAFLGFLWIVINPSLQMLVMGFVFHFFVPVKVDNYFLFLFTGLLPWNFFSQSLIKATPAFFYERNLIKKAKFPRETIVLSIIFSNLFHFLIALLLLIIVMLFYQWLAADVNFFYFIQNLIPILWLIPAIFLLVLFTVGLSLLTSSLNVRFRDVNFTIGLGTSLWFYITPIVYSLDILPNSLRPLFYLNPITFIVEMFHFSLLDVPVSIPSLIPVSVAIIILILFLGIRTFIKENENFDDWL